MIHAQPGPADLDVDIPRALVRDPDLAG